MARRKISWIWKKSETFKKRNREKRLITLFACTLISSRSFIFLYIHFCGSQRDECACKSCVAAAAAVSSPLFPMLQGTGKTMGPSVQSLPLFDLIDFRALRLEEQTLLDFPWCSEGEPDIKTSKKPCRFR